MIKCCRTCKHFKLKNSLNVSGMGTNPKVFDPEDYDFRKKEPDGLFIFNPDEFCCCYYV